MKLVRTRFAPSPTGFMHVGGVRTALFAWLLARQQNGQFILRLEDTDQAREVSGSKQHIMDSLHWLGLDWDEGPEVGGDYGPYSQSERLNIYKDWAQKLIESGRAYPDPYTPTQLEDLRKQAKAEKRPFLFRDHRPESIASWDGKTPLRFKSDPKPYNWQDAVMGSLSAQAEAVDDFIIIKSDGFPTYNFAHIIDDHLMQITHVIRSQEFIASVSKFLNLYEALELDAPIFATLPFVMGPDGNKKLSKRDGAKDILEYAKQGFLPSAIINFLATLGWNDGTKQEIFSVNELIQKFSLDRVQKSGARFDEQRLKWISGYHIRSLAIEELSVKVEDFWPASAQDSIPEYKKRVLSLVQERLKYFSELSELTDFFFRDLPINPELITDHKQLKKLSAQETAQLLQTSRDSLIESNFTLDDLTKRLNELLAKTNQKPAILFSLIRIATTQAPASPSLADTMHVLGKETTLRRIDQHISSLR